MFYFPYVSAAPCNHMPSCSPIRSDGLIQISGHVFCKVRRTMHCRHAVHGSQERVATGQDVSSVRRVQEKQGRLQQSPERRGLCPRTVHGGSSLGHPDWAHSRVSTERPDPHHACHLHQSHPCGQTGDKEHLRVPGVQDTHTRPHFRLDFQPENQGETGQVDHRWSVSSAQHMRHRNSRTEKLYMYLNYCVREAVTCYRS